MRKRPLNPNRLGANPRKFGTPLSPTQRYRNLGDQNGGLEEMDDTNPHAKGDGILQLLKFGEIFISAWIHGAVEKVTQNNGAHVNNYGRAYDQSSPYWGAGSDSLSRGLIPIQGGGQGSSGWITFWKLEFHIDPSVQLMASTNCLVTCDEEYSDDFTTAQELLDRVLQNFNGAQAATDETFISTRTTSGDAWDKKGSFDRSGDRFATNLEILCCGECHGNSFSGTIWSNHKPVNVCAGVTYCITPGKPEDIRSEVGTMLKNCMLTTCPKLFDNPDFAIWDAFNCDNLPGDSG